MLGRESTIQLTMWTLGVMRKKILIKIALSISYHILRSAIAILILAEAQKPRRRIGIADWKVFARLESFCAYERNPCLIFVPILWGHEINIYPDSLENLQPVLKFSNYFQLKLSGIFQMISGRFQNCLDSSITLITHYLAMSWDVNTCFLGLSCETVSSAFRKVFTRKKLLFGKFWVFCPSGQGVREFEVLDETQEGGSCSLILRWTIEVTEAAPVCRSRRLLSLSHLLLGVNDNNNGLIIFLAISISTIPSNQRLFQEA